MKKNRLLVLAVCLAFLAYNIKWIVDVLRHGQNGQPFGADFISFWSAGYLAMQGKAELAYNLKAIEAAHQLAMPGYTGSVPWHYPPPFLLVVTPLASLPFGIALTLFTLAGLLVSLFLCWRIKPDWLWILALLAAPSFTNCLIQGQNGWITAALASGGLMMLPRSAALGGALLGLLIYKPHFFPVAIFYLLITRQWKGLLWAYGSSCLLILTSLLVFGIAPWIAFIQNAAFANEIMTMGWVEWLKMGSTFVAARQIGASVATAWGLHILVNLASLTLAMRIWKTQNRDHSIAACLLATCLLAPFQFDYDLMILLASLAFWVRGKTTDFKRGEEVLLVTLWLGTSLTYSFAEASNIQIMPILLLAGLLMLTISNTPDQKNS